jgi:lysophospholipase L1-like esterase
LPRWRTALLFVAVGCGAQTSSWRRQRQAEFEEDQVEERIVTLPAKVDENPRKRGIPVSRELDALAAKLGARPVPVEPKASLDRLFKKLDALEQTGEGVVRILHLGDSHIAADYITRTIREHLQARFGNAGRGFVAIDQRARYGGRRLDREGWRRDRVVDANGPGKAYGFAGMRLTSTRRGASARYVLKPEDHELAVFFHPTRRKRTLEVFAEEEPIGEIETRSRGKVVGRVEIPVHRLGGATPPEWLNLVASASGVSVFGLSFESTEPGIIYDSIGPVGADAKVYLDLNQRSFEAHVAAASPDLIVLMVGGNDALVIRQGRRTLEEARAQHLELIQRLQRYVPDAACLLFGPMDAGEEKPDGTIGTKAFLREIRDMQRDVAAASGCGFWDTLDAMGGEGSFGRWFDAGIMNEDMVHPRSKGGDLVGHLFATALMKAYLGSD